MRFWDSSAVVPLVVRERSTDELSDAFQADPELLVWWATSVECISALARLEREGSLTPRSMTDALHRLDEVARAWQEIQPVALVRQIATRLLRTHPLRAGDAFQLAAALVAAEDHPETLPFVTLDDRLALAAEREGFGVERLAGA